MKKEVIVGIDPGQNGAIGIIDEKGSIIEYIQFNEPTPEEVADGIKDLIEEYDFKLVGMELVHVMPNQGVVSSGKFMETKGIIKGILAAYKIQYIEITPQKWRSLSPILQKNQGDTKQDVKKKSLTYVQQRWPEFECKYRIKDIDLCDSLCIAEFLRTFFIQKKKREDAKQKRLEDAREWMAEVREKQKADRDKRVAAAKKKKVKAKKK